MSLWGEGGGRCPVMILVICLCWLLPVRLPVTLPVSRGVNKQPTTGPGVPNFTRRTCRLEKLSSFTVTFSFSCFTDILVMMVLSSETEDISHSPFLIYVYFPSSKIIFTLYIENSHTTNLRPVWQNSYIRVRTITIENLVLFQTINKFQRFEDKTRRSCKFLAVMSCTRNHLDFTVWGEKLFLAKFQVITVNLLVRAFQVRAL